MPDHRPANPLPVDRRELLDAQALGDLLACSRSLVLEMARAGTIPAPVEFHRGTRWRRREIVDWLASGLPHADRWTWRPAQVVKLADLRDLLLRQAAAISDELRAAEAKLARGETMTMVSTSIR